MLIFKIEKPKKDYSFIVGIIILFIIGFSVGIMTATHESYIANDEQR